MFKKVITFIIASLFIFTACSDDPVQKTDPDYIEPVYPKRTVLLYIGADNSLNDFWRNNLEEIKKGALNGNLNGNHLVVYVDPRFEKPSLLKIRELKDGTVRADTLMVYPNDHNSASPQIIREVIDYVLDKYPAETYGLGLWSHGSGWLPENAELMTRSFGDDNGNVMEINDLKNAIPDNTFDYIFFDACYMACAEVAYALKDKTKEIMASSTEIMGTGYPYSPMLKYFFTDTPELDKACQAFYDYYNVQTGYNRTATISLIHIEGLNALVPVLKNILASHADWYKENPSLISNVQPCDYLYSKRVLFDLKDFINQLGTAEEAALFNEAFNKAVPYSRNTETCFFVRPYTLKDTKNIHGLTTYIMNQYPVLDEWYKQLDWYKAVY